MATDTFFTVPVTFGAQSTRGWFDIAAGERNEDPYAGASRAGRTVSLRLPAQALTGLGLEKDLTVDGRVYRIVDIVEEEDGRLVRLDLQRT